MVLCVLNTASFYMDMAARGDKLGFSRIIFVVVLRHSGLVLLHPKLDQMYLTAPTRQCLVP